MPSGRMLAWIVGLSALTYVGIEKYKMQKAG